MTAPADSNINIRTTKSTRTLIDRAAKAAGQNRSEFMLKVARERAHDVLLDQAHFALDEIHHRKFVELIDRPLPRQSSSALKRLLERKAPWGS